MKFKGHVKNGVVTLDDPSALPDGAEVEVSLASATPDAFGSSGDLMKFAGKVRGLPPDASENLDQYLYGRRDQ